MGRKGGSWMHGWVDGSWDFLNSSITSSRLLTHWGSQAFWQSQVRRVGADLSLWVVVVLSYFKGQMSGQRRPFVIIIFLFRQTTYDFFINSLLPLYKSLFHGISKNYLSVLNSVLQCIGCEVKVIEY